MKYQTLTLALILAACKGEPDDLRSVRTKTATGEVKGPQGGADVEETPKDEAMNPQHEQDPLTSEEIDGGMSGQLPTGEEPHTNPELPGSAPAFAQTLKKRATGLPAR